MKINDESSMRCISFSILKALLPSLNHSDICGVRVAEYKSSNLTKTISKFTSLIVRLRTTELLQSIISAKKAYSNNYLTTKNIDLDLLNPEVVSALPDSRIFVNEVLSTSDQSHYLAIKETAIHLGFKYVWHCAGKILVRWSNDSRSHQIKTVSDLTAITDSLEAVGPSPNVPSRHTAGNSSNTQTSI